MGVSHFAVTVDVAWPASFCVSGASRVALFLLAFGRASQRQERRNAA